MIPSALRTTSVAGSKPRKCRVCPERFVARSMAHVACSPKCAAAVAEAKRLKEAAKKEQAERAATRVRKEAIKTKSDLTKEAQHAFNAFIRARDEHQPCICCGVALGASAIGGGYDCGHYRSVGSAPHLRFEERNAHAQRKQCNRYGAGRAVDYRIGLISRIGVEAVEALEADNTPRKYTMDDLRSLKALYRAKLKTLKESD